MGGRKKERGGPFTEAQLKDLMSDLIEGQKLPAYRGDLPKGKPKWFDEEKFRAGRRLTEKYFNGVLFADIVSLTMLLFSPQVLKPLIFTGKSETADKAYRRYVATSAIVASWYRDDVWDEDSVARKSLRQVRKYHSDAAALVNDPKTRPEVDQIKTKLDPLHKGRPVNEAIGKDFSSAIKDCPFFSAMNESYQKLHPETSEPAMYFNQMDMSGTQFSFFGLLLLYPEKFGMARASEEEMMGFVHMWRCFGWLIGIDDRFNFCRFETYAEMRQWTEYFLHELVVPWMRDLATPEYEHMGRAVVYGARHYFGSTYESIYLYIGSVIGVPMKHLERSVSLSDRFGCFMLWFVFEFLGNLPFVNYVLNAMTRFKLTLVIDPPSFYPQSLLPPPVLGLKELWYGSRVQDVLFSFQQKAKSV